MARSDRRNADVLLRFTEDKRSLQQAKSSITSFSSELDKVKRKDSFTRLAEGAAKAVREGKNLESVTKRVQTSLTRMGATDREIAQVARQFKVLRQEAEQAASAAGRATQADDRFSDVSRRVGLFGDVQSNLGAVSALTGSREIGIVGEIAALAEEAPRLKTALQGIPAQAQAAAQAIGFGGAGLLGAFAGAVIGIKIFENQIKSVTATFTAITNARAEAAGTLANATTDVANAEIARLENLEREQAAILAQRQADQRQIEQTTANAGALGNILAFTLGDIAGPVNSARRASDEASAALEGTRIQLNALRDGADGTTVASNDAAAAEEQLRQQRQATAQAIQASTLQAEVQAARLNADQIQERINSLNSEREVIQRNIEAGRLTGANLEAANQRLTEIGASLLGFFNALPAARITQDRIEAEEALAEAQKKSADEAKRAAEEQTKVNERIKSAVQNVADFAANFANRIGDIQQRLQFSIQDSIRKSTFDAAEARRDASLKEVEIVRDAGLEKVQAEAEAQRNLAQIQRRGARSQAVAAQNRNAIALDEAKSRQQEEETTTNENLEARLGNLKRGLQEELRALRLNTRERLRAISLRGREELRRLQQNAQRSINLEGQRFQRELQLRIRNASQSLNISQQEFAQRVQVATRGSQQIVGITGQLFQGIINQAAQARAAAGQSFGPQPAPANFKPPTFEDRFRGFDPRNFQSFDTGGVITRSGLANVHAGEVITNPRRGQMPGFTFAPVINGGSRQQIRQQVIDQLDSMLTQAGL